ncbi:cytochrome c [Vibrio hannami]|uniref:c-type cytochrome n=1 Tax=Vibrio hannami TaxID=2717094 RepID=UPI00240ECACC|nr:cytochrome c [Vibrio hannami]MDG3088512.1 cytochrome c [Vibrio hannami]
MKKLLVSLLIPFSMTSFAADFTKEIEARQDGFQIVKDNVEMAGEMFESGAIDWALLATYGKNLSNASGSLKNFFPEGSQEGSNAKSAVWKSNDKFMMGLDKLNTSFEQFYAAAQNQDKGAAMAAFDEATGTCKACHRKFRVKK